MAVDRARPVLDPVGLCRRVPLLPHQMHDRFTSAADLFVLAHLGIPRIAERDWTLEITGLVSRPLRLSLADLRELPRREVAAMHQCAGYPTNPTLPTRRIANVRWSGVDLADLLETAGVLPSASFLWSHGSDHGTFAGETCDAYVKDMPLTRLRSGDVLVAYEVDGEPLSAEHGFPARLVVPGWYGTNSVKWLSILELADRRYDGLFTTRLYDDASGGEPPRPVWAIPVESLIVTPEPGSRHGTRDMITIAGWAWAAAGVLSVEVSADGGGKWWAARVEAQQGRCWQRFETQWRPGAGEARICSRAVSRDGHTQSMEGARNAVHTVSITVTDTAK